MPGPMRRMPTIKPFAKAEMYIYKCPGCATIFYEPKDVDKIYCKKCKTTFERKGTI